MSTRDPRWPTFLILGAPRSGTTFLYKMLGQHPDIFMSAIKEPLYFYAPHGAAWPRPQMPTDRYLALFNDAGPDQIRGEASTLYLADDQAADRIRQTLPDARLIAVLRQPVDRALSHYLLHRMVNAEPLATFEEALAAEDARAARGRSPAWLYFRTGLYAEQVRRYQERFPPGQLLFLRYEDLTQNAAAVRRRVLTFLDVADAGLAPADDVSTPVNRARLYRLPGLGAFLNTPSGRRIRQALPPVIRSRLKARLQRERPPIDRRLYGALVGKYREDILETGRLLGWNLSGWLEGPS